MTEPTPRRAPRWDAGGPPAGPRPAAASDEPRPAAAASAAPASPADTPRPAAPSAPRVDHDAPTAKLPPLPRDAARKREPVKKPGPFPAIAGSAGLFFAVAALLAFQMRAGADPALGAGEPQVVAQVTPAPRKVLIRRRVIVTRIVEHRAPRRDGGSAAPAAAASAPGSASSAPAPAAPAPAPAAPAPAPAPAAPLTTRSS